MSMINTLKFGIILVVGITMGRLIPHSSNFVPLIAMIMIAINLAKRESDNRHCVVIISVMAILGLLFSDWLLSKIYAYPLSGDWTWFSYSGYLLIALLSGPLTRSKRAGVFVLCCASFTFSFWLWSNLGVWLSSGMYSHQPSELLNCYLLALPFLARSLLANVLVATLFCYLFRHTPTENSSQFT